MSDDSSVNLGAVYETIVASELKAQGHHLYYYDNKSNKIFNKKWLFSI